MSPVAVADEQLTRLWEDYLRTRDAALRERLLLHYLPLVKQVAGRMKLGLPGAVEFDDLMGAGILGLIGCLDHFNPSRGFKFETYAAPRIRGAILDGLRDADWLPRSHRQKARLLDQTVAKLHAQSGRVPTDQEIAAELSLDEQQYQRFMEQVGAASLLSLDLKIPMGEEGESGSLHEVIADAASSNPLERLEDLDVRRTVLKLLESLTEQERAVVSLYYYEDLTFKEIGQVLNLSESRVCQIHTRLLSTLRAKLRMMLE